MKEIIIAENSGFCFGVRQAIEKAEKALGESGAYSCGPLIHNESVTEELQKKGLISVGSIGELPAGATLIVRSHGEAKDFFDAAEKKGIKVIDATCPFVQKIHEIVKNAGREGRDVVIVGDKNHPEVKGIDGWCENPAIIINSEEDAAKISGKKLLAVAQTTIIEAFFMRIVEILKEKNEVFVENTICGATKERQRSCEETAKTCDMMVVIGSKKSSNSVKLFDISKKHCKNSYFIENIIDLPLKDILKCNRIGITAGASTPGRVIKEVIAGMSEVIANENNETNLMQDLMDEIEKSLRLPRGGEIITGTIIQVTDREIVVNLGCKKDGIIPRDELIVEGDQKLNDLFNEGDEIQAKVLKTDDGDGNILLSRRKLEVNEHWNEVNAAFENKSILEVKVVKQVKGGVIASYKEVAGYIPLSQLSDRFIESADADEYVGKILPVKIIKVDQKKGKVSFSHRNCLMEERQKKIDDVWNSLSVDDIVEGTVMRFTDYGAFVDVGGLDGLLHISEISWGKLKHPQEVLELGQKIKVKVLSMNAEKGKISLGLKQTGPEPWAIIDEKYKTEQIVKGRVVQIKEYGAFVELEPGLDGLVHISEVAHKRVTNIANELSVGQDVSAKILEINKEKKRISLSIKETIEKPIFEEPEEVAEAAEEKVEAAVEPAPVVEAEPVAAEPVETEPTAEEAVEPVETVAEETVEEAEDAAEAEPEEVVKEEAEEIETEEK